MRIYLITVFGISDKFYTGTNECPFQGLIQENRAASPGFLMITVMLMRSLYWTSLILQSTLPILKITYHLAGQIFVDDSDFSIMNNG